MSNKYAEVGYKFEGKMKEALKHLQTYTKADIHRYPDKKSAGVRGRAVKAPADFYAVVKGKFNKVEAKASNKYTSLRQCMKSMVKDHQMAELRKAGMAGGQGWVIFYSAQTDNVEFWTAEQLAEYFYATGSRLPKSEEPTAQCPLIQMKFVMAELFTGKD
jgi:penicillin-binding protein-related factor A (putative recombinase)